MSKRRAFLKVAVPAVLFPLAAMLIMGTVLRNPYVEGLPFGVVDLDGTSLSRTVVHNLKRHPTLAVDDTLRTEDEARRALEQRRIVGMMLIPRDYYRDLRANRSSNAVVVIDGTNTVIASNVQQAVSTVMATVSAGYQMKVLESRGAGPETAQAVLSNFSFGERVLYEPTLGYQAYLIHLSTLYVIQMVFFSLFLVPFLIERKNALGIPVSPRDLARRLGPLWLIADLAVSVATWGGFQLLHGLFGLPEHADLLRHTALITLFLMQLTAIGLVWASAFRDPSIFTETYLSLSLVFMMTAGITWPAWAMPPGFDAVTSALWPMITVALPFKALHLKNAGWAQLAPTILQGLAFTAAWGALGTFFYIRSRKRSLAHE
jgi:ABC-2 type transport system permease protein